MAKYDDMSKFYDSGTRVITPGEPLAHLYICPGCQREFWIMIPRKNTKTDTVINSYLCPDCRAELRR